MFAAARLVTIACSISIRSASLEWRQNSFKKFDAGGIYKAGAIQFVMTKQTTPGRRGPKPSPERREAIEAAALHLFAKQGIAATSTRQIAASAGTTERTLFKYFGSKDSLATTVLQNAAIHAMRPPGYARIVEDHMFTPAEFIAWHRDFLTEHVGNAKGSSDAYRLLFSELFGDRALAERFTDAWFADVFVPLRGQLKHMRTAGALPSRRSDGELTAAFFNLNLGYLVTRFALASHRDWDASTDVDAVVAMFASLCGWEDAGH